MPRLFTSRFGNKELQSGKYTVVGVVRSMPKWNVQYEIAGNIIEIAPPWSLWNENDRTRFTQPYFRHLEKTGYKRISAIIESYLGAGKDVVLCCYEDVRKPDEWCHRLVFAEWWEKYSGEKVEELPDPSPNPGKKKEKTKKQPEEQQKETGYQQLSFIDELRKQCAPRPIIY